MNTTWRTVSADGHAIAGTFDFTNANPGATRATPSTPAAAAPATTRPADDANVATDSASEDEGVSPSAWILVAALVLAAAGGGTLWYRRSRA